MLMMPIIGHLPQRISVSIIIVTSVYGMVWYGMVYGTVP